MQYRVLGTTGWTVSAITFGAWQIGDAAYWGGDTVNGEAAVHAALDAGINLFDTAEMYGGGESERALGAALGPRRGDVYIASKILPDHCVPGRVREACEASLRRLGTDWIDLHQIHWPFDPVRFESVATELAELKSEGKIRMIGVSNFGCSQLTAWKSVSECISNQLGYNLLSRAIEYSILPECQRLGIGVLAYMPLLQGILSGRWGNVDEIPQARRRTRHFSGKREGTRHGEDGHEQLLLSTLSKLASLAKETGTPLARLAMAWIIAQPGITSVIAGAKNPGQVRENAEAGALILDTDLLTALDEATVPLKQAMGPNADLWLPSGQTRIR